jgi:hypothetical protein
MSTKRRKAPRVVEPGQVGAGPIFVVFVGASARGCLGGHEYFCDSLRMVSRHIRGNLPRIWIKMNCSRGLATGLSRGRAAYRPASICLGNFLASRSQGPTPRRRQGEGWTGP